jgi:hypothetical protein
MPERRNGGGRAPRSERPGLDTTALPTLIRTTATAMITEGRVADLLAWRCRHGCCVDRPLHDYLDWWPAWALESRWSA